MSLLFNHNKSKVFLSGTILLASFKPTFYTYNIIKVHDDMLYINIIYNIYIYTYINININM